MRSRGAHFVYKPGTTNEGTECENEGEKTASVGAIFALLLANVLVGFADSCDEITIERAGRAGCKGSVATATVCAGRTFEEEADVANACLFG